MENKTKKILTKLGKKKVELSLEANLVNYSKEIQKLGQQARDDARRVEKLFQDVNRRNAKIADQIKQLRRVSQNEFNDARSAMKKIGIDMPNSIISRMDEIEDLSARTSSFTTNIANVFPI